MPHKTDDLRIKEIKELVPPSHLLREFLPLTIDVEEQLHFLAQQFGVDRRTQYIGCAAVPTAKDRRVVDVRIRDEDGRNALEFCRVARDFEGVRAECVRRTTTIPAGKIGNELPIEVVSEEWYSPELQILLLTESTDPRLGTSTYRVFNITRSEPPAYLFEVPSDYTVEQTAGRVRPALPVAPAPTR